MENRFRSTDDEHGQRFSDGWARRILACPRARCRRSGHCMLAGVGCPALAADPFPQEQVEAMVRIARRMIRDRLDEIEAGPAAKAAGDARRRHEAARRRALAFQRAREAMRHTRE